MSSRFLLSSWYEDNMYDKKINKRILLEENQPEKNWSFFWSDIKKETAAFGNLYLLDDTSSLYYYFQGAS